jgi:hypothetical protein
MTDPPPLPRKLLPFPWVFATRRTARELIEHIESCHRIINAQATQIMRLQSELNRPCQPRRP